MSSQPDKLPIERTAAVIPIVEPGEQITTDQLSAEFLPPLSSEAWDKYQQTMERLRQSELRAAQIGRSIIIR